MNYNIFLDRLEKAGLLIDDASGILYEELPLEFQKSIKELVDEIELEARKLHDVLAA